jgi:hypothetical protein
VMLLKFIRRGPGVKPVRSEGSCCTSPSSTSIACSDWLVPCGGGLEGSEIAPESDIFGCSALTNDASLVHSIAVERGGPNWPMT